MIKALGGDDLIEVVEFGLAMKERTVYQGLEANKAMVFYQFRKAISSANMQCYIARHGRVTGFILLEATPYWWADPRSGPRYVTDLAFFSQHKGDGRALLEKALEWAKSRPKVVEATFQHSSGIHLDTVDEVYESVGLERLGSCWWTRIEQCLKQ